MIKITWDKPFLRLLKKWKKKYPELISRFQEKLTLLSPQPFHPFIDSF